MCVYIILDKKVTLQLVAAVGFEYRQFILVNFVYRMENIKVRILHVYEIKENCDIILRKSVCVDETETECKNCKEVFQTCFAGNKIIFTDNRKIVHFQYNCPICENRVREILN